MRIPQTVMGTQFYSRSSTVYQPEASGPSLQRLQRKNLTRRSARRAGVLLPDQRRRRDSPLGENGGRHVAGTRWSDTVSKRQEIEL